MAQTFLFADDGVVPNNPVLPVILFAGVADPETEDIEARFRQNEWGGVWVWSVYDFPHYHPDAHEALFCLSGWADLQIGGENGRSFRFVAGDGIVLPAGTGHQLFESSADFTIAGAYPIGQEGKETRRATEENYPGSEERVAMVALPKACPFFGTDGPTMTEWS